MAKFFGAVGFGESVKTGSGIFEDVIVEHTYFGDVIKPTAAMEREDTTVLDSIRMRSSISIVADPYAWEHYFAIRYVKYEGALWTVNTVSPERPRIVLRLGGVYNGPTP